jgi:RNA polymerase sigma-70 factor (ECF subfamily)
MTALQTPPPQDRHRTTQQLVLQSQLGDRDAFNRLFDRYYPRIRLVVRMHMLDKLRAQVEPDDVIQEVYLEVFRNFHKFEYRDPDSFYKWVVTVVGWKICDFDKYFFKTTKRQPGETLSLNEGTDDQGGSSMQDLAASLNGNVSTPSRIAVQSEGYRMLETALESLPPHYRQVIRLRHLEQRSAKETAEILAVTLTAANALFHRALRKLHENLREMAYFTEE